MIGAVRLAWPRERQLHTRSEFDRVFAEGRVVRTPFGIVRVLKVASDEPARVGIVVPRALGDAPDRNRARRRVREAFRLMQPELPRGTWIVVSAHGSVLGADFDAMRSSLRDAVMTLGRAG